MHFERASAVAAKVAFEDLRGRINSEALKTKDVQQHIRTVKDFIEATIREAPATSDHSQELSETIRTNKNERKNDGDAEQNSS